MTELGLKGTIVFFGEPAEKLRLSKPVHAAKGYYDKLDAAISFHPTYMLPLVNTARWDTHCGAGYACIYTFECAEPESWLSGDPEFADPGQPRRGAGAGRDRCPVPHVRPHQADPVQHAALHPRLVAERGDPDGGAGDGRQPAGADRGDPVSVAHPDHRDGGAGRAGAGQQCRGCGQGGALHLEARPG